MASWKDVRQLALALPGTEEETSSTGRLAWTVNKKGFVWERPLRRADLEVLKDDAPDGPILGVRTADLEMKEVLLASDPAVYFTTPRTLKDVILEAWLARAPKRVVTAFLRERR